ncbi:MAG: type II toxin-antitoxin system RelE/ParE family toxin [bacterium]
MHNLNFSKQVLGFIESLQLKQKKQISNKIQILLENPNPQDSKKLKGGGEYFRVDVGEYRIIYSIGKTTIFIFVIGKRNDDEVYRKFKRVR